MVINNPNSKDHLSDESSTSVQMLNIRQTYHQVVNTIFTQMSASKGIKQFGKKAIAAVFKELKQLNDGVLPGNPVIEPIELSNLSEDDKNKLWKLLT